MSKINSPLAATTDGASRSRTTTNWAATRDASAGDSTSHTGNSNGVAINVQKGLDRAGDDQWTVNRAFFAFDTSQVSSSFNVFSAQIKLANNSGSYPNADVIVVKSNKPDLSTGIANADFDDLPGISAGNTMDGNVTDYSSVIASGSWPTADGDPINIDLNAAAIADIKSGDVLKLAFINYNYDYKNIEPASGFFEGNGMYFADTSVPANRPVLQMKYGFNHKILGVATGSIAKIVGVDDEKVKKVFSKDSS